MSDEIARKFAKKITGRSRALGHGAVPPPVPQQQDVETKSPPTAGPKPPSEPPLGAWEWWRSAFI
jgi:hypothetical protein